MTNLKFEGLATGTRMWLPRSPRPATTKRGAGRFWHGMASAMTLQTATTAP